MFDGFFGVVAVEAVLFGFSFHPSGNLQISQRCCTWKLSEKLVLKRILVMI